MCRGQALLALQVLRLDGKQVTEIDNLESFDQVQELYLHYNAIERIENLDFLGRLRLLSLGNNAICVVENIRHLRQLEVLDLSANQIAAVDEAELPPRLAYLDVSENPCIKSPEDAANLRRRMVQALPFLREWNRTSITPVERRQVMGEDSFVAWGKGPASRAHCLYIPVIAEKPGERSLTAKVEFRDADDLKAIARRFCHQYDISEKDSAVTDIVAQMEELISATPRHRLPARPQERQQDVDQGAEASSMRVSDVLEAQDSILRTSGQVLLQESHGVLNAAKQRIRSKRESVQNRMNKTDEEAERTVAQIAADRQAFVEGASERRQHALAALRKRKEEVLERYRGAAARGGSSKE